ncbi:MAG: YhcH/YjgK/YiaL family protein [Patescibacteria group bacterium]
MNETNLVLAKNMFAIFFENDIHRTGCTYKENTKIKKVVVKIAIDALQFVVTKSSNSEGKSLYKIA